MKKNKFITALLAVATLTASISALPTMAEDDPVVYTYIGENDETVNITQSELNVGHWDTEKLGDELPIIFDDFPASITEEVNEFSELNVCVKYMKTDVDYAILNIIDAADNTTVFTSDIKDAEVQTPVLPIGKVYQFKIVESVDGVENEYNKYVTIEGRSAAMPEYVTDSATDSEQIVLVGNVEDLRASEHEDEDGNIGIDGNTKRFDQIKACDLEEYLSKLDVGSIYKIYTRDENGDTYLGYINTEYDVNYIYVPTIKIEKQLPSTSSRRKTKQSTITGSMVKNANATVISQYKDYGFDVRDTSSWYQVYKFEVPDVNDDGTSHFEFRMNASTSTTFEAWILKSGTTTPVKKYTRECSNAKYNVDMILGAFNMSDAAAGDYIYFVFYSNAAKAYGYFSFREAADEYSDDVSGSLYEIYKNMPSTSVLNMDAVTYYHTTTNYRDVDAFYLNYSGTDWKRIKFTLNNHRETNSSNKRAKYVEAYILMPKEDELPSIGAPGDIFEVPVDKSKYYICDVSYQNQYFMSVSDVSSSNSGTVSFNSLNTNVSPCTYSVWSNYKN